MLPTTSNEKFELKSNWTKSEIESIYNLPLLALVYKAAAVHHDFHPADEVQICTLLSIKTGACPENCSYCPQSAHHDTNLKVQKLMPNIEVMQKASEAKASGATRFCMGAAWREVKDNQEFEQVLEMVRSISQMGMEVCCTLGMITESQAHKLKAAGLYAYNHNLDTSESFYKQIISTRTYQDRLDTLNNVRKAGITVCCGGIIGMGESDQDRIELLMNLANMNPHPESVPVNALVAVEGTPLEKQKRVDPFELVRMIATARILMPKSMVRLSAGRLELSKEAQALCFMAGANSVFAGEKLLTTANPEMEQDMAMFKSLGLTPRVSYKEEMAEENKQAGCGCSGTNTCKSTANL